MSVAYIGSSHKIKIPFKNLDPIIRHRKKIFKLFNFIFYFFKIYNKFKSVPAGFEPATFRLTVERSNQLSYGTFL